MALALDGSASLTGFGSPLVLTLTTVHAHDVIVLFAYSNGDENDPVVSGAGLTWHKRATVLNDPVQSWEFYAIAAAPLAAAAITVTWPGGGGFYGCFVFGVSGANTSSPFDGSPVTDAAKASGTYTSISTTNPKDFIFGFLGMVNNDSPIAGAGWTQIAENDGSFVCVEYRVVSTPQAGLTLTFLPDDDQTNNIADAIKAASSASEWLIRARRRGRR